MQATITIYETETETGNYKVVGDFPAGCNMHHITAALKEQNSMITADFAEVVNEGGSIHQRLETFFEVKPPSKEPYQFTCIYCPAPVDVNNGQEICNECLNETAPTY